MNNGKLIIISGPSGVGKGTLVRRLLENPDLPLVLSVSATTRAPRPGEIDGIDYHFLSADEFERRKKNGDFLEYFDVFGGRSYGTLKSEVDEAIKNGRWIILEIDVNGAKQVLKQIPDAQTIFILPPDLETLQTRLIGRGTESPEMVRRRLNEAQNEIEQGRFYQHRIVNRRLDDAVRELTAILSERR